MVTFFLFIFGLILGSFLNASVWRLHKKQGIGGRSYCDHCGHTLAAKDLVPVASWLALRGRCRYCAKSISWQHPAIELATGVVFAASYIWWPFVINDSPQRIIFGLWLLACAGLIALAVYDLRYMLLPNKLIYPTLAVSVVARLVYVFGVAPHVSSAIWSWAGGVVVASGLFFVLYMVSHGKWIGYGDVRLGLITGTWLASPTKAFLMIFLASLAGSLTALALASRGQRVWGVKIPYGPFLIGATIFVAIFGQSIIDWYNRLFLG